MRPFRQFIEPCVARHAERRDDQDAAYLEAVMEQMFNRSQGNRCFAQTHIKEYAAGRVCFYEPHAEGLIGMKMLLGEQRAIPYLIISHIVYLRNRIAPRSPMR